MHSDYVNGYLCRLAITSLQYSLLLGHTTHAHITAEYLVHEIFKLMSVYTILETDTQQPALITRQKQCSLTMCASICVNGERLEMGVFEFSVCPYYTTQLRVHRVRWMPWKNDYNASACEPHFESRKLVGVSLSLELHTSFSVAVKSDFEPLLWYFNKIKS